MKGAEGQKMSTGILAIGHETILTDLSTSLYLFCLPEFFNLDIFLADPGLGAKVLGGVVPGEPEESGEARCRSLLHPLCKPAGPDVT